MEEKRLTDEEYKKILDGVMEQAEKDFGEVVVENMFDEAVIDTLKEMAIKHSNDSYVYRVLVNAINLIQGLKDENESFGETINQASETLRKQKAEIERLTSLYDGKSGFMTSSIGDLPLTVDGLRKAVDEIARLYRVQAELQEYNEKNFNDAKDLRRKNAELQKQVDELTAFKNDAISTSLYGKGRIDGKAVANDIWIDITSYYFALRVLGNATVEIDKLAEFWHKYGVEVE